MDILVSIIIPTYNRAAEIIKCLDSLISQTYSNFEIVVVDDGSTDNTKEVIEAYISQNDFQGKLLYFYQLNQGAPAARNHGLEKAHGDLIVFFDSDDLMLPDRLSKQVEAIMEDNSDSCACGFKDLYGEQSIPKLNKERGIIGSLLYWDIMGSTITWMYKKEILLKLGGYDLSYPCYQDWDLSFRYLTYSQNISLVYEVLSIFVNDERADRIGNQLQNIKRTPHMQRYFIKVLTWLMQNNADVKLIKHVIFLYAQQVTLAYLKAGKKGLGLKSINSFMNLFKEESLFISLKFKLFFLSHLIRGIKLS